MAHSPSAPENSEAVFHSAGPAADIIGKVETHGIDVIPASERHGKPSDLFPFWFGTNVIFTYILFGGILIQLGLSLAAALVLAVVGNLVWLVVGIVSIPGPRTGTATMVVSRAQYGFHGNRLSCFFSWVANVGYEGVDWAIAALACYSLADYAGVKLGMAAKAVILLAIIAASFVLALLGHATILWFAKWSAWALGIASIVFAVFLMPHVKFNYAPNPVLHGNALMVAVLIGISLVLSGPLSYPIGSDYSRYLPENASARQVIWYTALGGYIPTVVLTCIGIFAATAVDASNFTTTMAKVVPSWFYPIFLLIVIIGVMVNSVLSVYSSGLSLQALGVPLERAKTVWIDAVIGGSLAVYGVLIATNFLTVLQNFLLWSIYWYAPVFGVFVAELALTKGYYKGHELFQVGGRYWYSSGYRWRGVAALVLGMAFSALSSNTPYFHGYISTDLLNGGDVSAVGGFAVGAIIYWVLCVVPDRRKSTASVRELAAEEV
jgi:NCS1 family nucleobase:cation symporter-1